MRVAVLMVILLSCSEAVPFGPAAQLPPAGSPEFFAAALQFLAARASHPVIVDPRPLRPEAMLYSVAETDLLLADSATIALRTRVIKTTGLRVTDATHDWECVFAEGIQPPPGRKRPEDLEWAWRRAQEPDSLQRHRAACRAHGDYVSLAFGLPQAGTDPDHPERWRIRAIRMLLYGWEVVDLFLVARPNGTWEVVDERRRIGVFS